MNADKCKVQCSKPRPFGDSYLIAGDQKFPIVEREKGFAILGTALTLDGRTSVEFQHRVNAAWGKFHSLWPLLGKKDASLHRRLRLFDSTVTRTALWCSESWTLTTKEKRKLRTTQREMLRRIVDIRRATDESYVDWIIRATGEAEAKARASRVSCWLELHLQSKWAWAARLSSMPSGRWARRVTLWRDSEWWSYQERGDGAYGARPIRAQRGSQLRWEDDLRKFCTQVHGALWQDLAKDVEFWSAQTSAFCQWAHR